MYSIKSLSEFINERYYPSFKQQLILEGGAFGHMSHPFEDFSLTFGQVKDIIRLALQGELDKEVKPVEKLDGQALAVSWKNGHLIASRGVGDRRNAGSDALTVADVADKFKDHPPTLKDAFSFAAQDLEQALSKLNSKLLDEIFMQGKRFMHLEIIWPDHPNVISYDTAKLIFHSVTEYDDAGRAIGDYPEKARQLEKVIKQVNAHIQKNFEITPPVSVTIPKHTDFSQKQSYFIKKVTTLQKDSGLLDSDRISDYISAEFEQNIRQHDISSELTEPILTGLLNRWVHGDKSYNIRSLKKDINNPEFLSWIINFDKKDAVKYLKELVHPLEILFLELGATILKNISGFLAVNPDTTVQKIRKELETTVKQIEASDDLSMINKLQGLVNKVEAIGGFDAIVPVEGVVFVYNGKQYKFTGAFAPVNQITGMLKFNN